ncbi:MAG TPA: hypothetical protein VEA78_13475, partial [Acidimicrobiales bacterium]|nr:hypothetical protein [Acidimicrobiales bacterium]
MLDRPRAIALSWAALCFALFGLLAVAVVSDWSLLVDLDHRGEPAQAWAVDEQWLRRPLRGVEVAFGTVAMTAYTVVLAGLLLRRYRRAAIYTAGVMLVTSLTTTLAKAVIDRDRPPWQSTEALLHNGAFPSGHASAIGAFGGIVIVLVAMLVRRSSVRRSATLG